MFYVYLKVYGDEKDGETAKTMIEAVEGLMRKYANDNHITYVGRAEVMLIKDGREHPVESERTVKIEEQDH